MAAQAEIVRQSELLNQLVINRDSMEELGRVEVLWMYAPSHRVLGFVSKSGLLGAKKKAFKISQVTALGTNGILTHSQPEETNAEKVSQLESVINCEVWSDSGKKIGKVIDYIFNLRTGEISKYLFVSSNLGIVTGEIYQLFPSQILGIGRNRVLVPDYALKNPSIYQEGIKQKLTKVGEFLKEEKEQVTQEFKTLTQRTQETTQQAKGRLLNLTEQLKERAQSLSQEAREKLYSVSEQLKEEAQILVEQAREKSGDWYEQAREQTHSISEQVEEGIQTLTVQAKEILDSEDDEDLDDSTTVEEDPEDFFDRLFKDEETEPSTVQASPSAPSKSLDEEAVASAPPQTPQSEAAQTSVDEEDTFGSILDDLWDTPPIPTPAPIQTPSTSTQTPSKPLDSTPEENDDEPWI